MPAAYGAPSVAYVVKGYPRLSETFILNEIHLLESMGMSLRVFSLKHETEGKSHSVVDRIEAPVVYLGEDSGSEGGSFVGWLRANLLRYLPHHLRLLRRRPLRYLQTVRYVVFRLALRVHLDRAPSVKRSPIKDFLRAGAIAAALLDEPLVLHIHAHFCHGSTTMALLASHITGIPFSFTAHAKDIYLPKLNPAGLLRVKIEAAEFVVTCTDANRRHLERLSPGSVVRTIYHGLDTAQFSPRPGARPSGDDAVLLSVGRLVPKKGFPTLLRACAVLRDRGVAFRLRIVGPDGGEGDRLACLVDELGLESIVSFEGSMTQAELLDAYGSCTAMALACEVAANGDRDGIPNVLVEAMAMETPVLATRVSGIPELVQDGVNGMLVDERSPVELADAIEALLRDEPLRIRVGRAARATVLARFDSARTTGEIARLFGDRLGVERIAEPVPTHVRAVS